MIKNIKILAIVCILIASCSKSDDGGGTAVLPPPIPNTAPTAVGTLSYPTADLLCIDNTVNFQWSAATDADGDTISYRLTIGTSRNLNQASIVEQSTTTATGKTVTLQTGTAYYWNVVAFDGEDEADASPTFAFYTESEGESNHTPFTAALNTPALEAFVDAGTITLDWTGSDVDTADTLTYDVYFGETINPVILQTDVATSTFDVTTVAATTYYWRVDTKDGNGVKSIGQEWTFSTN